MSDIAKALKAPYITVRRDLKALQLPAFTDLSDNMLLPIIEKIIKEGHSSIGAYVKIMGALREQGIRIPLRRLNILLVIFLSVKFYELHNIPH